MACKRKLTDNEKEMERLRLLLNEVESSEDEIDQASENEPDIEMYSSHDSGSEFEQDYEDYESSDSEESTFVSKNKTVWQKKKSKSENIPSDPLGSEGIPSKK